MSTMPAVNLETLLHCDFCGLDFDPACAGQSCQGCPLARGCSKVNCPRCGYPILPEAKLITWLKKISKKPGAKPS
jgi:hypothetical protein